MDEPINFVYEDTDSFQNEISELYSYGEESEFFANRNAFEECMEDCGLPLTWKHMVPEQQTRAINNLMSTLEVSCRPTRIKSCRALAYLVQGNFGECLSLEEQAKNSQDNVFRLYQQGLFQAFVQQLLMETDSGANVSSQPASNLTASQIFNDSSELRLILSVLCTITETMYHAKTSTDKQILEMRQQFISDLHNPIGDELLTVTLFQMLNNFCGNIAPHYPVRKITLVLWKIILITLGGTQTLRELKETGRQHTNLAPLLDDTIEVTKNMRPCSPPLMPDGQARSRTALSGGFFNKRKVFKQPAFDDVVFAYAKECLLNSLAELNQPEMENENSEEGPGYYPVRLPDGTTKFVPDNNDESENSEKAQDPGGEMQCAESDSVSCKRTFKTSDHIDDTLQSDVMPEDQAESPSSDSGVSADSDTSSLDKNTTNKSDKSNTDEYPQFITPKEPCGMKQVDRYREVNRFADDPPGPGPGLTVEVSGQQATGSGSDVTSVYKGLPWTPKVRKADLIQHLSNLRQKFLGYTLPNDLETTFGLPDPIVEGINVLKKHMYTSLSEIQLDREELLQKYPLTHKEVNENYKEAAAEKLYSALLPRLPQYMIALLKILLAASTSTKNKPERTDSINIMCELNPENNSGSIIQTMKMNADANRHKEVIIKSVSAILLLLLKHLKVNHIYQFEYVSQQLMFANCIPLILKFLSQDIYSYVVTSKSTISAIDFPACVIGEQPELTTEAIELCSFQPYCWRNMFSCINLVRILNKLTKWKHSRIMMLVVFKSAPTLSKALSVRHSMFQLYVLKLLKVQLKFLGRQWKKNNMKLMSAIYQKVRHRLTDDWAYSNDNEARPWDFQAEEFTLQAKINQFHQRRYLELLAPNNKPRRSSVINQADKFGGLDDCIDEDYDFGNSETSQISSRFEKSYESWLESEVFRRKIDWDKLLNQ